MKPQKRKIYKRECAFCDSCSDKKKIKHFESLPTDEDSSSKKQFENIKSAVMKNSSMTAQSVGEDILTDKNRQKVFKHAKNIVQ